MNLRVGGTNTEFLVLEALLDPIVLYMLTTLSLGSAPDDEILLLKDIIIAFNIGTKHSGDLSSCR